MSPMRWFTACALLVCFQVCFFPYQGAAYIPLEISPELTVGGGYDDNVFLRSGNREGDFVGRVQPRLSLALPLKRMDMALDQSYYYYYNGKHRDEKAYQVQGRASMYIIKDLLLSISDKYLLVPVEVGRPEYSPVNLTKANELDLGALFDYELTPRTTSQWKYDFVRADFFDVFRATYYAHKAGLQIKQDITDALSFYLEYSFLNQAYTLGKSYTLAIHQGAAGLSFLYRGLIGETSFGLQTLDSGEAGKKSGRVLKVSIKYPATERLEASAAYTQTMSQEITGKIYDGRLAEAGVALTLGPRLQATARGKLGDFSFHDFPLSRRFWGTQTGLAYEIISDSQLSFTYDHYEGKDNEEIVIDNRYFLELRWVFQ